MPTKTWIETPLDQEIASVPSEGYAPFYFGPETSMLLFKFNAETFLKVLSALMNGAALTYPNEYLQVVWYFLENVEFPVEFCAQMIACITTDEYVRSALKALVADAIENDPVTKEAVRRVAAGATTPQIVGPLAQGDCDNSVIAGRVIAIVDRLNTNNEDALEIIEVGTNDEERVASVLSAIPVLGESPADEIINLVQGLLEDFSENYSAAVTEEWKDDVAEDLYCLTKESEDCTLTYEQVFNYFQNRAQSSLTLASSITNIIQFVINGDFGTDDLIASGLYAIQLAFIVAGRQFFGINAVSLSAITRDAGTSSAWEDWDECAPPPEDCFDFTVDEQGWIAHTTSLNAMYSEGHGWYQNNTGGVQILSTSTLPDEVTSVRVSFDIAWSGSTDYAKCTITVQSTGGTAAPLTLPGAPTFLMAGNDFDFAAPSGYWAGQLIVSITAGGGCWPQICGNPAPQIYLSQICLNQS